VVAPAAGGSARSPSICGIGAEPGHHKIMRCQPRRVDFAYAFFVAGTGVPVIFRFTEPRKRALVK
jgi:hypothetical protein